MQQHFINTSELELDGDYLERVKAKLESYKESLEKDPNFVWLGSQDDTLEEAQEILKSIESWEIAKKFIDSRVKDNQGNIEELKHLVDIIPGLLEKDIDHSDGDCDEEEEESGILISLSELKKLIRIGQITYLQGTIHRHSLNKTESLFLNRNDKIRPPLDKLQDDDSLYIDEISLKIGDSELEVEAVAKIIDSFK